VLISSGARLALPMVVAPEAIRGCLQPVIDSNIFFVQLFFLEFIESFFSRYIFPLFPLLLDGILEARDLVGPLVCKRPLKVTYK
jgi:hypothetical protein